MSQTSSAKKLGLLTVTSLVVGGMIGSGIFTLPSTLAQFGGLGLSGWVISAIGALVLAKVFGIVSKLIPETGGPYAYTQYAFGDLPAFIVGWGYWLSIWSTNSAIALTFTGYLSIFIPVIGEKPLYTALSCIGVIWLLTAINGRSVAAGGRMQLVTTILKIVPILAVAIAGIFVFNIDHFSPINPSQTSSIKAITVSSALCLFAFMGLEAASIPAGNIKNPEKNIAKATLLGVAVVVVIYLVSSISLFGILPPSEVQNSMAPFSDAAEKLFGVNARYFVAAGACISTFGALNGWILIQGQLPLAMSKNKAMPKVFGRLNSRNTPTMGIVITSILISLLLIMNQSRSFSNLYAFMVLLTTVTVLVSYLATVLVYTYFVIKKSHGLRLTFKSGVMIVLGIGFALWMIIGSGVEAILWGGVGLLLGIPLYIWVKRQA